MSTPERIHKMVPAAEVAPKVEVSNDNAPAEVPAQEPLTVVETKARLKSMVEELEAMGRRPTGYSDTVLNREPTQPRSKTMLDDLEAIGRRPTGYADQALGGTVSQTESETKPPEEEPATAQEAVTAPDMPPAPAETPVAPVEVTQEAVIPPLPPETTVAPIAVEASQPAVTVESFMASPAWESYRGMNATEVFLNAPSTMPPELQEFRKGLFELLRASGIGPKPGENLESYIENAKRSEEAVANHPKVIRTPDGTLVAGGGDVSARFVIANEYLARTEPEGRVYVESPTGIPGEYVEYHSKTTSASELAPKRLTIDTAGAEVVF